MSTITDLQPIIKANRQMYEIDDTKIYFYNAVEDGWVYKLNSEGRSEYEYRTYQYYTYTPEIAIDLVEKGYALWDDRAVELRGNKLRYNINMKAVY